MLPEMQADFKGALDMGCSFGEAEDGRIDKVLQDAAQGTLAPIYNYMADLPCAGDDVDSLFAGEGAQNLPAIFGNLVLPLLRRAQVGRIDVLQANEDLAHARAGRFFDEIWNLVAESQPGSPF